MVSESDNNCPILNFLRASRSADHNASTEEEATKTFPESGDNDLCFEMNIVFWVFETFHNNPEFYIVEALHTGNSPVSFKIVDKTTETWFTLVSSRMNHTLTVYKSKKTKKTNNIYVDCDFLSVYGSFIIQNLGINFVNYGYIDNERYADLFYNNHGLSNDIVAHILQKVIQKRNYVTVKNIWIDLDECAQNSEITINNVTDDTTDYDISLLVFKALVTINTDDYIITEQFISQMDYNNDVPFHYRVGNVYEEDYDGKFTVKDYIIKRQKNDVKVCVESQHSDLFGEPVWNKFVHEIC